MGAAIVDLLEELDATGIVMKRGDCLRPEPGGLVARRASAPGSEEWRLDAVQAMLDDSFSLICYQLVTYKLQ